MLAHPSVIQRNYPGHVPPRTLCAWFNKNFAAEINMLNINKRYQIFGNLMIRDEILE